MMQKSAVRTRLKERLDGAYDVRVIARGVVRAKAVSAAQVSAPLAVRDQMSVRTQEGYGDRARRGWEASGCAGRETTFASGAGGGPSSPVKNTSGAIRRQLWQMRQAERGCGRARHLLPLSASVLLLL
jgi:hypothetical protein